MLWATKRWFLLSTATVAPDPAIPSCHFQGGGPNQTSFARLITAPSEIRIARTSATTIILIDFLRTSVILGTEPAAAEEVGVHALNLLRLVRRGRLVHPRIIEIRDDLFL